MAEAGHRRTTGDHGKAAPGWYAYQECLAGLRSEQKARHGWENAFHLKMDLTVNPDHTLAFQTLSGDHHTGHPHETPRTKHPRGPNGRLLLASGSDAEQLMLFSEERPVEEPDAVELSDLDEVQVWIFLTHRTEEPKPGNIVWHSELSLPHSPDERGHIRGWYDRIPLPPLRFDAVDFPEDGEGPEGLHIPIDFR
ncbi:hypothetical protein ACWGKS_28515 [Nocardiopsis sp. NPDC055879]